jgi:hypothetical protein
MQGRLDERELRGTGQDSQQKFWGWYGVIVGKE